MKSKPAILGLIAAAAVGAWIAFGRQQATFGAVPLEEVRVTITSVLAEREADIPFAVANIGGELFEVPDAFCTDGEPGQKLGHAGSINNPIMLDLRYVEAGGNPVRTPAYVSPSFTARDDWWIFKDGEVTFKDGVIYAEGTLEGYYYPDGVAEGDGTPVGEAPVAFAGAIICQE